MLRSVKREDVKRDRPPRSLSRFTSSRFSVRVQLRLLIIIRSALLPPLPAAPSAAFGLLDRFNRRGRLRFELCNALLQLGQILMHLDGQ